VRLSGFDYAECYRTDPVRGYFFQAEATTLAFEANASEGSLYLDRRFVDSFPSVRFLVTKPDVTLYAEGDRLLPQTPPVSLIAWPHSQLESALEVLPQLNAIELSPGPRHAAIVSLCIVSMFFTARPLSQLELTEPVARFEGGITFGYADGDTRRHAANTILADSAAAGYAVHLCASHRARGVLAQVDQPRLIIIAIVVDAGKRYSRRELPVTMRGDDRASNSGWASDRQEPDPHTRF
jgi:hypothetical protein